MSGNAGVFDTAATDVLVARISERLLSRNETLVTAESCTGGWVAMALTARAGSSAWFDRGWVTYSNAAKHELLGVATATLAAAGAVSEATVAEMAAGALARSPADWALAVSGIAGPGGATPTKPVGTVCFAVARRGALPQVETCRFPGDRHAVRAAAVAHVLQSVVMAMDGAPTPPPNPAVP